MAFRISLNQLWQAFVRSVNSGMSIVSTENSQSVSFPRGIYLHNLKEFIFQSIGICHPWSYFKHPCEANHLLLGQLFTGLVQQIFAMDQILLLWK